jgi:hypothetical protein
MQPPSTNQTHLNLRPMGRVIWPAPMVVVPVTARPDKTTCLGYSLGTACQIGPIKPYLYRIPLNSYSSKPYLPKLVATATPRTHDFPSRWR